MIKPMDGRSPFCYSEIYNGFNLVLLRVKGADQTRAWKGERVAQCLWHDLRSTYLNITHLKHLLAYPDHLNIFNIGSFIVSFTSASVHLKNSDSLII